MSITEPPKVTLDQYGLCGTCGDHLGDGCCQQCHYVMERLQHDPIFSIAGNIVVPAVGQPE